jgi:hypothetical protein
MKRHTALIALSVLGCFLSQGCQSSGTHTPSQEERVRDAQAAFERFQTTLKEKNTDAMADCLTDGGTKTFFDMWQKLMAAEGIQAGADDGFYALTKDAKPGAEVVDNNTVRLLVPVKLKNASQIVVTVIGSGDRCKIDRFESVR